MKTYVISLSGSARRDECRRLLDGIGMEFEFFDAYNGRERAIEDDFFSRYDEIANATKFKRPLSPEEIGCYLSHIDVWEKVAISGAAALVLEDDFAIEHDAKSFLDSIPSYLIKNSIIKVCSAKRQRWSGSPVYVFNGRRIRQYRTVGPHTTGYVIDPAAAAKLLKKRDRFSRPVDIDLKYLWEHGVTIYGVTPALVGQRGARENSTIDSGRKEMKPKSSVRRFFANMMYQVRFRNSELLYRYFSREQYYGDDRRSKG
nr:glycosyltransferase family 25 protein [Agrobacterium tumefaciens]